MRIVQEGGRRNSLNVRIPPFGAWGLGLIATAFLLALGTTARSNAAERITLAAQQVRAEGAEHDRDRRAEADSLVAALEARVLAL